MLRLTHASRFAVFLLGLGVAAPLASAGPLPPIAGELEGDLVALLPGTPKLHWRIAAQPPRDGLIDGELSVTAPGTRLKGTVRFNPLKGEGTWRLESGELEPGAWIGVIGSEFVPSLVGTTMSGNLRLTGEGVLRDGQLSGRVSLEWTEGAMRNAAGEWALEGITLRGAFSFDAARSTWASLSPLELTVKTISTKRFGARNFALRGAVDDAMVLSSEGASIEMAGGNVMLDPFKFSLDPPDVTVKVQFNRIGLQDVAALVPTGFSEARGRVDGEVELHWSKASGLRVGAGILILRDDEPAIVRLEASPGLLTEHVPERFALLPAWLGPLARWFAPINPAYADLKAIEMGQISLRGQSLTVRLTPEGDGRGRSASVALVGRPEKAGGAVDRVTFQVDVNGPLSTLMQLSMDDRTRLKFSR